MIVDSDGNDGDADLGDQLCVSEAGACTLRAALEEANALALAIPAEITFARPMTIEVPAEDPLPAITHDRVHVGGLGGTFATRQLRLTRPRIGRLREAHLELFQEPSTPSIVIQGLPYESSPTTAHAGLIIEGAVGTVIEGLTIRRFAVGISVEGAVSGTRIGSDLDGISDSEEGNLITENIDGVRIESEASDSILQFNTIRDNLRHGIWLPTTKDARHTITRNIMNGNGRAAISVVALQAEMPAPMIERVEGRDFVSGTGCPGCIVEIFTDPADQAARYVDGGTVAVRSDGKWSLSGLFLRGPADVSLTATQRDPAGSTSRLSEARPVDRSGLLRLISIPGAEPRALGSRRLLVRRYKLVDAMGAPVPDAAVTFKPFGDRLRFDSGPDGVFEVVLPVDFASEILGGQVSASISAVERRSGTRHAVTWLPRFNVGISRPDVRHGGQSIDLSALTADGIGGRLLMGTSHRDGIDLSALSADGVDGRLLFGSSHTAGTAVGSLSAPPIVGTALGSWSAPPLSVEGDAYGAAFVGAPPEMRDGPFAWQESLARGGGIYEFIAPDTALAGKLEIIAPIEAYDADRSASACGASALGATVAGWKEEEVAWVPLSGAITTSPSDGATAFAASAEVVVPATDSALPGPPASFTVGFDTVPPTIAAFVEPGAKLVRLPSVIGRITDDASGVRATSGIEITLDGRSVAFDFDPASGELVVPHGARDLPSKLPVGPGTLLIRAQDGFCNSAQHTIPVSVVHGDAGAGLIYLPRSEK